MSNGIFSGYETIPLQPGLLIKLAQLDLSIPLPAVQIKTRAGNSFLLANK